MHPNEDQKNYKKIIYIYTRKVQANRDPRAPWLGQGNGGVGVKEIV